MSNKGKTGGIGVQSGQWLQVGDLAKAIIPPKPGDAPKPVASEEIHSGEAVNDTCRAMREKLETLDEIYPDRPTLDAIPVEFDIDETALDKVRETDRPIGGEESLVAIDDKLTGESARMVLCFTTMQNLAVKVGTRGLLPKKALKDGRYFPFAFPHMDGPDKKLVMHGHVVDIDDLRGTSEALTHDFYALTAFKDYKAQLMSREERINLIKALTVFYADYAGILLDDMNIDYLKAMQSLKDVEFKPASKDVQANLPGLNVELFFKTFSLKLMKTFLHFGTTGLNKPQTEPQNTPDKTAHNIIDLSAVTEAKNIVATLVAIGNDLKKALEVEKIDRSKAVSLIEDMLFETPLELEDYLERHPFFDEFEARIFINRVLAAQRAIVAMKIDDSFVFNILGENFINNAAISEADFEKFAGYINKKNRK